MTNHKSELSWLNVLFCMVVVFIHVLSNTITTLDPFSWQYLVVLIPQRLSCMAVPGFFILSGIKLFLNLPDNISKYYLKRARTLLLPYLISVIVYYLWYVIHYDWNFSVTQLLQYWLLGSLSTQFYFLIALIQFILLTPLWKRWVNRYSPVFVLPLSIVITHLSRYYLGSFLTLLLPGVHFSNENIIFTNYLFFYLAGCYIGRNYQEFLSLLIRNKTLILSVFVVFGCANVICSALHFSGRAEIPAYQVIHLTYCTTAVMTCFLFVPRLQDMPAPLKKLNRVTYLIYLYHCLPILIFDSIVPAMDAGLSLLIKLLFVFGIVIPGCLLWHYGIVGTTKNIIQKVMHHG